MLSIIKRRQTENLKTKQDNSTECCKTWNDLYFSYFTMEKFSSQKFVLHSPTRSSLLIWPYWPHSRRFWWVTKGQTISSYQWRQNIYEWMGRAVKRTTKRTRSQTNCRKIWFRKNIKGNLLMLYLSVLTSRFKHHDFSGPNKSLFMKFINYNCKNE